MNDEAREILRNVSGFENFTPMNRATVASLEKAAKLWENEHEYFYAGHAYDLALRAAWGDGHLVDHVLKKSYESYTQCLNREERCSHEALAALKRLLRLSTYVNVGPIDAISQELAQRLVECFSDSPYKKRRSRRRLSGHSDL